MEAPITAFCFSMTNYFSIMKAILMNGRWHYCKIKSRTGAVRNLNAAGRYYPQPAKVQL